MRKKLLRKNGLHKMTALVIVGWVFFVIGFLLKQPVAKLIFTGIARVLPYTL